jgi:hypothetical protein
LFPLKFDKAPHLQAGAIFRQLFPAYYTSGY